MFSSARLCIHSRTETELNDDDSIIRCNTHPKLVEEGGGGAKGDEGAFVVEELDAGQRRRKQFEMEKKHGEAKEAWKHFADNLGNADVKKFLNVR